MRPPAPLRPLGAAALLDGAVRLVTGNLRAVLAISLPLAVLRVLLSSLVEYAAIDAPNVSVLPTLAGVLVAAALGVVLTGLLAPLFSSALLGVPRTAGESVRRVGRRAVPLVGLALVVTAAEGAGLVACGVGGVWLWGVWALAAPAFVLERTGVGGALRRSFRLVSGAFWRTWGLRALGWVLTSVLGLFVAAPFDAIALAVTGSDPVAGTRAISSPALYLAIVGIGGLVVAALLAPVSAAVDVLIYTDQRMRREGMDIVLALPMPSGPVGTGSAVARPGPAW